MFLAIDHIDTLIAADYYEESGQPLLSEVMKLLNRPCLEVWNSNKTIWTRSKTRSAKKVISWSCCGFKSRYMTASRSRRKSTTKSRAHTYDSRPISVTRCRTNIGAVYSNQYSVLY